MTKFVEHSELVMVFHYSRMKTTLPARKCRLSDKLSVTNIGLVGGLVGQVGEN
jgi:hypothetical protein